MDNLPRSVRDLIELVGTVPAMALIRAYPGNVIKVPTGARDDSQMRTRLIGIMGTEAADKFISTYGGERLAIPRCLSALIDARDTGIIAEYDGGKPVSALAVDYSLTERQIRTILKRTPTSGITGMRRQPGQDDKQLGLF